MPSIPITTAPTWLETARREPDRLRTVAFALAIVAVEFVLARGIAAPEIARYVYLFLGVFVVAAIFRFPLATALAFIGFTDFVFHPTYFAHNVGSLSVRPHELALACLLAVALVRPARRTWGGRAGTALAVFFALVGLSGLLAIKAGDTTPADVLAWGRPIGLLAFFYVVVRLFPSARQRSVLLTGTAVLAAVTGVIAVALALGAGFGDALAPPGGQLVRSEVGAEGIERVRLVGLSAGYAIFWFCVVRIAARGGWSRVIWSLLLAGITLDIAVSLNRNMWLGLAVGAALMAVFGGSRVRSKMALGATVAVAGVVLLAVFGSSATNDTVVNPIVKRGETIFKPSQTTAESSLEARERETNTALETAQEHLLLGVGLGAPFGVTQTEPIRSGSFIIGSTVTPQLFLHNQYLYLVLISGIPGLIAFLFFLGAPLLEAFRRRPFDPAIVACGVGIVMVMISAVVAIYFSTEDMTVMLALLVGVIVADGESRRADPEATESGL